MSDCCCRVDGAGEAAAALLPMCDAEHMVRVRDGHDESFAFLLEKHRASVVGFLYRMLQDHAQAEDLAQEVFLRVYLWRRTYQPTAKFTTWLFQIAINLALNARRDGRKERFHLRLDDEPRDAPVLQAADAKPSVEQDLLRQVRLKEVRRAVAALPGRQRAAVLMHKYEEMSYAQIAEALDCSVPSVKSLLFRAYETLRGHLRRHPAGAIPGGSGPRDIPPDSTRRIARCRSHRPGSVDQPGDAAGHSAWRGRPMNAWGRRQLLRAAAAAAMGAARGASAVTIAVRPFGRTGVSLPVLGMGSSPLVAVRAPGYGAKPASLEERAGLVRHAYDRGVRYFDTARSHYDAEEVMGLGLKGVAGNCFLATKVTVLGPAQVRAPAQNPTFSAN